MAGEIIRPKDLTPRPAPVASELMVVDNSVSVGAATIKAIVESGRPAASQAEAQAGTDASKAMTPLTTKQSIAAEVGVSLASKAQGDLAATAVQPSEIGTAAAADIGDFATAAQGSAADSAVQPGDLAVVATSGSYGDLSDKPPLGSGAFKTIPALITDTTLGYAGAPVIVGPGDVVEAGGCRYLVMPSSEAAPHVTTAGGVKLHALPTADGSYTLEMFGADGLGSLNDAAALVKFIGFYPAGARLVLGPNTYGVDRSLVWPRPISIEGATKETSTFKALASGTYRAAPFNALMVFPHDTTPISGVDVSNDPRRSILRNFGVTQEVGAPVLDGFLFCTPVYGEHIEATYMRGKGFRIEAHNGDNAGNYEGSPCITGNANGIELRSAASSHNGGDGLFTRGNNANACEFVLFGAFQNGGWGINERGFLGNHYLAAQTDANGIGGITCIGGMPGDVEMPNFSTFTAPYTEGNQPILWKLGKRNQVYGPQEFFPEGDENGVVYSAVPSGDAYVTKSIVFADTKAVANSLSGGRFSRIGRGGWKHKASSTHRVIELSGLLSGDYTDLLSNGAVVMRFANSATTGNIDPRRPFIEYGFIVGGEGKSGIVGAGAAPPASGFFNQGAIWLNSAATAGGKIGWVCTAGGTPGTWKAWGSIDA